MDEVKISAKEYEELVEHRRKAVLDALKLNEKDRAIVEDVIAYYTTTEDMQRVARETVEKLKSSRKEDGGGADPVSMGRRLTGAPKAVNLEEEGRSLAQKIITRKRRGGNR